MDRNYKTFFSIRTAILALLVLVFAAVVSAGKRGPGAPAFDISWHTIDGGGGTSTGASFAVSGTIGQPDAGAMTGGSFMVQGGFWPVTTPTASSCPADIAPATPDGAVNVLDLLAVIGGWGMCTTPCPPYCNADVNQDCTVNVLDLLAVIGAWGEC